VVASSVASPKGRTAEIWTLGSAPCRNGKRKKTAGKRRRIHVQVRPQQFLAAESVIPRIDVRGTTDSERT
jgi:hypothetical protein